MDEGGGTQRASTARAVGTMALVAVVAVTGVMVAAALRPPASAVAETRTIAVGEAVTDRLSGRPHRYAVAVEPGQTIQIELTREGSELDPYLQLTGPHGGVLAEDDDGAGDLNSRIRYDVLDEGEHLITAGGLGQHRGTYRLTVRER